MIQDPKLANFLYTLFICLGIAFAFVIAIIYLLKNKIKKEGIIDLLICACFAVACGIIFSVIFENLYELIEKGENYSWTWGMTFYGGLFGGVLGFLLTYYLMRKNVNFDLTKVVVIAPLSITIAHALGRIGCFFAGCCYGKHTDSWIGLPCSKDFPGTNVIPTQIIEAIFLIILFGIMLFLLISKKFKYNFVIYMVSYGIFRFVIEFFRDDPRGQSFALTPSQIWCIILIVLAFPTYLFLNKVVFKHVDEEK